MPETAIVGIDLGTTNSVVAVVGEHDGKGEQFGPVTVLWDTFKRLTHASAICRTDDGLTVGDDAKVLAAEGYTPVRFAKKYMGTQEKFRVGDEDWLPEQVSAEVLKHLAKVAQESLGVPIEGVVITHPAYFDGLAISATKRAGTLAGIKVAGLLMEPIAAAMAYTHTDPRQHLRILVYDLGGGTFDITLVERSGATFRPVSFGGNRELGGYNVDKKIAGEMLDQLQQQGYVLKIDSDHPERDPRWASLMHHAEEVKFRVGAEGAAKGTIRKPNVFQDDSTPPKAVQLAYSISRDEFLKLIEPELAETIRETRKVLETAQIPVEKLDYLLLVGGSCRLDAVKKRLEAEFGLEPKCDESVLDLSVAVGAAMVAATSATVEQGVKMEPLPKETDAPFLAVAGQVLPSEERKEVGDLTVTATGGSSGEVTTMTSPDGRFWMEVELLPEEDNELTVTILDAAGEPTFCRSYTVRQGPPPPPPPPPPILPKAISVETVSGFSLLAPEGSPLPFRGGKPFRTVDELTEIELHLYQEDIQLTTIPLTGFEHPVPANCRVELEIEISEDYELKATAQVPSASISKTIDVKLPPVVVPPLDELREEYARVRSLFSSQMDNTPDGEQKARIGIEADRIIEEIEALLNAKFVERFQAHMLIKKLYLKAKELSLLGGLMPPRAELMKKIEKARSLWPKAVAKDASLKEQQIDATLNALEAEANRAYQENDASAWSQIDHNLDKIIKMLKDIAEGGGGGGGDLPPAPILVMLVQSEIGKLRQQLAEAEQQGKVNPGNAHLAQQCRDELDAASQELAQVNVADPGAQMQIVSIYQQHLATAEGCLEGITQVRRKSTGIEELG